MLAEIDLPISMVTISVVFGLLIGMGYGILAERSKFCLRRALAGVGIDRQGAFSVWLCGFATAMLGTQILIAIQVVDLSSHRQLNPEIPYIAAILGGAIFGTGMILTRGCISRLTVLTGTGNLRALTVAIIFAIIANATLKGVLSPIRVWMTAPKIEFSLANDPAFVSWTLVCVFVGFAVWYIVRHPHYKNRILMGGLLGLLVPMTWYVVSVLLFDAFNPKPIEGLSFTLPHADTNFWIIASTAIAPNFGIGFIGGVILGAFLSAWPARHFEWQSFETTRQTARYLTGAIFMGVGGVLAGGCSVGNGLSGMSLLSPAAFLALASMMIAGYIAGRRFP